jgi:tRNA modification GTPase
MRAPRSFTGEDVVEFHLHGSPIIVQSVVGACVEKGARLARPGEFTQRAFFNGRLDLAQAEAVANLVAAQTKLSHRLALRQLEGGLSRAIHELREELLDATAELEAWIDFPEEDIPFPALEKHTEMLQRVESEISRLLKTFRVGQVAVEGARVALVGAPNAGKSSLFNALVGRERAIVTPHPGTTRDTIESTVDLMDLPITLVDTAGLRDTQDEIEALGIERSRQEVSHADVVVWVIDCSVPSVLEAFECLPPIANYRERLIVALNKIDVAPQDAVTELEREFAQQDFPVVRISCTLRIGLDALEKLIRERLIGAEPAAQEVCITNLRHANCLGRASEALKRALDGLSRGMPPEFISLELQEAIAELGAIVGLGTGEEILDRIFSRFCIGK